MNYKIDTLADIIAQLVQFARDDYQNGVFPEAVADNCAYVVACFVAQHTADGDAGVESREAFDALAVDRDMPFSERAALAHSFITSYGGEK
jgi:hypothetical protein